MGDLSNFVETLSVWALPVLLAVTLHEAAHGYVAYRLGDDTAARAGRLTLNPLAHVDPFGTVLLPLMLLVFNAPFLFGYAKPVPVRIARLRNPKRDMVWVALAGPGANIALALASGFLLVLAQFMPGFLSGWLFEVLRISMLFNCLIAVFNMLPIPPLDGGRVLTGLLPGPAAIKFARIEPYGLLILIGAIFVLPMLGFSLFSHLVVTPTLILYSLIRMLFGL